MNVERGTAVDRSRRPRLVFDAILIPYFLRLGSHPVHSLA